MVSERKFNSVFDYGSAFKYDSIVPLSKPVKGHFYKSAFSYHSDLKSDESNGKIQENSWISTFTRITIIILFYILTVISFPFSMWICIKRVNSLERIVLMRLGKLQPIREPGFTLVLPFIDIWDRIDLRPQVYTVSTSQLLTADGAIIEAKSDIQYQISDVISYVTKLKKQEKTLKDLGLFCLTNIISEKDQEDILNKRELIGCLLKDELNGCSLRWGLEIIHVSLHSVNILKAAEPMNALEIIMNALKATTGQSSHHVAAIFPFSEDNAKESECESLSPEVEKALKNFISAVEKQALLENLTAKFKFEIVGNTTKTINCAFTNGHISVLDDSDDMKPDVSVIVTEDNMKDLVNDGTSPFEAYMNGKMMVAGDWTLLRPLESLMRKPLSF